MSEVDKSVLIDAVTRFQERGAPNIHTDNLDVAIMRQSLQEQPELFFKHVNKCNSGVFDRLVADIDGGIETSLVKFIDPEEDQGEQFGVVYVPRKGVLRPRLTVSTNAIDRARNWLGPLYAGMEVEDDIQTEAAVAMVAWMGLASWLFEKLDPRLRDNFQEFSNAHIQLAKIARITPEELEDEALREEKIDNTMIILQYRLMGSLAYASLLVGESLEADAPSRYGVKKARLDIFHSTYQAMFHDQMEQNREAVTPMFFALAYPLNHTEKEETIKLFSTS